jgi:hypothetical protein
VVVPPPVRPWTLQDFIQIVPTGVPAVPPLVPELPFPGAPGVVEPVPPGKLFNNSKLNSRFIYNKFLESQF